MVKRGDVWLVALNPTIGTEIQKTRPWLVVSPDDLNERLRRVIVAPMTSGSHPASFRIETFYRGKSGRILLDQVRTIDKSRLRGRAGTLPDEVMQRVLAGLGELFAP